jgi:hypothetical protein
MTRNASARVAGVTYLFYIAVAFPDMVLLGRATAGESVAASLANVARHPTIMRVDVLLTMLSVFSALVLAVTLYGVTRVEDQEIATLGLVARVGEGVVGASLLTSPGLLWLATASGPNAPDASGTAALGALLLRIGSWKVTGGATLFAVGSTAFSYLLLRGRMIPAWLAWLGVVGSALLVIGLPLEAAGFLRGTAAQLMWVPVALFELTVAPWLIVKGVPPRAPRDAARRAA